MNSTEHQSLDSKRGEILFRRRLAMQQSGSGRIFFEEAHSKQGILDVMRERMLQTRNDVESLAKQGRTLTPYVELGAERVQRALVLENEYGASGFALDISLDMLRYASVVAEHFGYARMPVRIVCDAYNLPFRNESIPFAFCYQTLHHFPDPQPICEELLRMLMGEGILFIDDEPVRGSVARLARIHHRKGHRENGFERLLDRVGVLALLSKADQLETEHGILEEEFDIATWRRALLGFDPLELVINRKLRIRLKTLGSSPAAILAQLAGGNIRAVVKRPAQPRAARLNPAPPEGGDRLDLLCCPNCSDRPHLTRLPNAGLVCPQCTGRYPEIDGVFLLFEKSLGYKLYPEYFSRS